MVQKVTRVLYVAGHSTGADLTAQVVAVCGVSILHTASPTRSQLLPETL